MSWNACYQKQKRNPTSALEEGNLFNWIDPLLQFLSFTFLLETLFKVTFLLLHRPRQRPDYFWHFSNITYDLTLFKRFRNSALFSPVSVQSHRQTNISLVSRTIIYNYSLRRLKWRAKFRFKDNSLGGTCLESARAIMKLVLSVL